MENTNDQTALNHTTTDPRKILGEQKTEFKIGNVFSRSFSIYLRNFVPFLVLTGIILSPTYIYNLFSLTNMFSELPEMQQNILNIIMNIFGFLLPVMVTAAVVYGTYQDLCGRHATLGNSLRRGLPLVLPVAGIAITVGVAAGLAAIALVIPGLIVMTMYLVAVPAAVIEKKGVMDSLKRSAELTKGFRWQVFGAYILLTFVNMGVASAFVGGLFALGVTTSSEGIGSSIHSGSFLLDSVITAFSAVVYAVIYNDLRIAKEGGNAEQIAAVFD